MQNDFNYIVVTIDKKTIKKNAKTINEVGFCNPETGVFDQHIIKKTDVDRKTWLNQVERWQIETIIYERTISNQGGQRAKLISCSASKDKIYLVFESI